MFIRMALRHNGNLLETQFRYHFAKCTLKLIQTAYHIILFYLILIFFLLILCCFVPWLSVNFPFLTFQNKNSIPVGIRSFLTKLNESIWYLNVNQRTCMQSCVLLNMWQLLESSITVGTLVRFFAGMNANVLHQLMIGREALQTLLTLMWFDFATSTHDRRQTADIIRIDSCR